MRRACSLSMQTLWGAVLLAASSFALAGEVVETYPDGSVRLRYETDDEGRAHGAFTEYYESGELRVVTKYRAGLRDGGYTEYFENGKIRVRSRYRADERTGNHSEYYENGRVRLSAMYRADVLNGDWIERYPNGDKKVEAEYEDGKLDGRSRAWDEGEIPTVTASYRAGVLHGERRFWDDGRVLSNQRWEEGRIAELEGVAPYPVSRVALMAGLHRIREAPVPEDEDAEHRDRRLALIRLREYRFLCGLAYDDVVLDDDFNRHCADAARVCRDLGYITHFPKNPGWPADDFRSAYRGASSSNLYQGYGQRSPILPHSVDAYMDDSDPSNIDKVGHRRWCLNPEMKRTGFGAADGFCAMWSIDSGRASVPEFDFVCYPPRGYAPNDYWRRNTAWSVSFDASRYPAGSGSDLEISVRAFDDEFRPAGDPLPLENVRLDSETIGSLPCIIFRPVGLDRSHDARYWVEIRGLGERAGEPARIRYLVHVLERLDVFSREEARERERE